MTTSGASDASGRRSSLDHVVERLIDAINHLDGLDRLDHSDLGILADVLEPWPGPIGDFAIECRSAWRIARPPTRQDIAELADSDSIIDWTDEAGELDHSPRISSTTLNEAVAA